MAVHPVMALVQIMWILAFGYFVYLAYRYLGSMASCACVNADSAKHLQDVEYLLLVLMGVGILAAIVPVFGDVGTFIKKHVTIFASIASLYGIFLIGMYVYFVYYATIFKNSFTQSCECAMQWQRWIVYVQYGIYLFDIVIIVLTLLVALLLALFVTKKVKKG